MPSNVQRVRDWPRAPSHWAEIPEARFLRRLRQGSIGRVFAQDGEAIESMTDRAFAAAAEFPRYRHDGATSLQAHLRTLPGFADATVRASDLVHTFEEATQITAEPWARAQTIQRLLPAATVTVRFHRLSWRTVPQAPSLTRYGIVVVQSAGPITLRREYDAGQDT